MPKIIWVIGSGTDVGKTTIAAGFVRVMNRMNIPTVGFKPFAAGMLKDLIDFMLEKTPNSKCAFFGSDGWELSIASPLTGSNLVDTVVPAQFVCHLRWGLEVLARTGSVATGDVDYFRSNYTVSIQERPDIVDLAKKTGLPFASAEVVEPLAISAARPYEPAKQQRAFDHLVALGAKAVVCEGGHRFLPVWPGCPNPDHVVVVSDGMVRLFPNLEVRYDVKDNGTLVSGEELLQHLDATRAKHFFVPLYVVESRRRKAIADQIAEGLIQSAGAAFL